MTTERSASAALSDVNFRNRRIAFVAMAAFFLFAFPVLMILIFGAIFASTNMSKVQLPVQNLDGGEYSLELARAQIKAAGGRLDGMVVWGDVAYKKGMLFSPAFWRK